MTEPEQRQLILLIDDDFHYLIPVSDALEAAGFRVTWQMHPDDVMEWLNHGICPDLILCDLMIFRTAEQPLDEARQEGLVLIRQFRTLFPDCPILALTGVLDEDILAAASDMLEPQNVILKPADPSYSCKHVRDRLSQAD